MRTKLKLAWAGRTLRRRPRAAPRSRGAGASRAWWASAVLPLTARGSAATGARSKRWLGERRTGSGGGYLKRN